jgi:formylglycine-generating enzyme required for sulfatase activity/serine/threonine protein kinase
MTDDTQPASPTPSPKPAPPTSSQPAGERVQSTATGELMAKLAQAPKLDAQRFVLDGELGQGGMGLVLRVHDQFLNRRLAMKVLLQRGAPRDDDEKRLSHQLLGRFLEEAQVTSQLDHPGVVPVHELGLDQTGKVYFTMRMVKGRTASEVFADAFHRRGEWDLTRALEIVLKVCDTMSYAHDKGVLHRDLKPANVMVGRFGEVHVMDWGLAKVLGQQDRHDLRIRPDASTRVSRLETARKRDAESDAGNSVVSMDGQQLGTPSYMSPEQARSEDLDVRADVYSIGAMLYELVTGSPPYLPRGLRKPAYRILDDVVEGPPSPITKLRQDVPAELCAVIDKAMARARSERYASTAALAADVRAFLAQRVVAAYRTGAWQETKLWVKRNRPLAASLAAAVLLLVAGIAVAASLARSEAQARQEATQRANEVAALAAKDQVYADLSRLRELEARAESLWPAVPSKIPELHQWLADFEVIAARGPAVAVELATLRERALPASAAERAVAQSAATAELESLRDEYREASVRDRQKTRAHLVDAEALVATAGYTFAARDDTDRHAALAKLTKQTQAMKRDGDVAVRGALPAIRARIAEAERIGALMSAHEQAWSEAIAAIAQSDLYGGCKLRAHEGVVPIGMDRHSRLWEFVHLGSGEPGQEIPPRDAATGRILPSPGMGIVLVLLPGGTFSMGAQKMNQAHVNYDPKAQDDEGPVHMVTLSPYFVGKHEVTRGQWLRLTGARSSDFKGLDDQTLPVPGVWWWDAEEQCRHAGLRLPTEAQWEFACRAGTQTPFWTGHEESTLASGEVYQEDQVASVASKAANAFGLYDMAGNVQEWCFDAYAKYTDRHVTDPVAWAGTVRVVRGGATGRYTSAAVCRSADRRSSRTGWDCIHGFRVVLAPVLVQ